MDQQFKDFVSRIGVMKPAHIDEDNKNHIKRMDSILLSSDYIAEEKVDGCHYLCFGGKFLSTENVDKTDNYPHLRDFFISLGMPNIIIDGEINYPGKTSQYCTRVTGRKYSAEALSFQQHNGFIHYTMWDILRTPKGTWLLNEPFHKRRAILEEFYNRKIKGTSMEPYIHITKLVKDNKKEYFNNLIAQGQEGIVLKNINSFYHMGQKPMWQWMKLKQKDEADLILMGLQEATVEYKGKQIESWPYWRDINDSLVPVSKDYYMGYPGALILGAYVNGELVQICTCSGLNEDMKSSLSNSPNNFIGRVCKISYMEKTEAGYPRHPRFEMFHESKTAKECTWILAE